MNAVVYYSNTGESRKIAEYFSEKLGYPVFDIGGLNIYEFDTVALVFPVHCQNIPKAVKGFLKKLNAKNVAVAATYGKMCRGNVLYEAQNRFKLNVIAGAYIPTKHSYIEEKEFTEFDELDRFIEKIKTPTSVKIPRLYKNPLANFFPKLRSAVGVRIETKKEKCIRCGECGKACKNGAIECGSINYECIRCLACVNACKNGALTVKYAFPMKIYLNGKKHNDFIFYV